VVVGTIGFVIGSFATQKEMPVGGYADREAKGGAAQL
jgi:hypothetical protein